MNSEYDYLITEGHKVTQEANNEADFMGSVSDVDLDEEARKTATNLLIGVDAGIRYFWDFLEVPDPVYERGVDRLAPVVRKYGGGELPPWMLLIQQYQDEFQAGVWLAGFAMEIKKQIKQEAERKEAEQKETQSNEINLETISNAD